MFSAIKDYAMGYFSDTIENKIDSVGDKASEIVADKIYNFLYADTTQYGINNKTGERVTIYNKNSPVINNLFKSATGHTVDNILDALPLGAKQISKPLRTYLENMASEVISHQLSNLVVKKLTVATLMAASNKSQAYISDYFNSNQEKDKNLISKEINNIIPTISENEQALLEEQFKDINFEGNTSLMNVLNRYKAHLQSHLNDVIRDYIVEGIAEASRVVGEQEHVQHVAYFQVQIIYTY